MDDIGDAVVQTLDHPEMAIDASARQFMGCMTINAPSLPGRRVDRGQSSVRASGGAALQLPRCDLFKVDGQFRMVSALCPMLAALGCGDGGGSSTSSFQIPADVPEPAENTDIAFVLVENAGLDREFSAALTQMTEAELFSGGLAATDYDGDGDIDLYVVGGVSEPNHLYENQGDGTFLDVAEAAALDFLHLGCGPTFGDVDGDGDLDLFIGAVEGDPYYMLENRDGVFLDVTDSSGVVFGTENTISATFFDYDVDGRLDLFLAHWGARRSEGDDTETVWRNNGSFTFTESSVATRVADGLTALGVDRSFTPSFADIDADGDGDLLLVADFNKTQVYVNNGDGTFSDVTDRDVFVDQAGMGSAIGDYDNDGDMDWFVTSIYNLDVDGGTYFGNRLYKNWGSAVFEDVTDIAGVADGGWGWATCFADFDNDGHLDLFHVNGWIRYRGKNFTADQVRFFHSQGDGTFRERATEVGLEDTGQGRGLACFDAERDGDIDIVITNNSEDHIVYYRNDTSNGNHYLGVKLAGAGGNRYGVGANITVTTASGSQVREIRAGNNYVSQNPLEVHVGLGVAEVADVIVLWPDGMKSVLDAVSADQLLTITHPDID